MNALEVDDVSVVYGKGSRAITVLTGVDITVTSPTVVGIVGESGSGKSTLARVVAGLVTTTTGSVSIGGTRMPRSRPRKVRRRVQMAFQDPSTSLNPRMTVEQSLLDACEGSRAERAAKIPWLLEAVGLDSRLRRCLPGDLSGGQRQRVSLARAIAARPDILICDEVTAALDATTRSSVLRLLKELQREHQFVLLFISHDIGAVRQICDDVVVMYSGQVVEAGPVAAVIESPTHPYTRTLLDAVPSLDRRDRVVAVDFEPVDPRDPPTGCRFHPRCPVGPSRVDGRSICVSLDPGDGAATRVNRSACHFVPLLSLVPKQGC